MKKSARSQRSLMAARCCALTAAALLVAWTVPLSAQRVVTGTVLTARGQRPVPGAEVNVMGTNLQVVTDNRGEFTIRGVAQGVVNIIVARIGYQPKSVTLPAGEASIIVRMTRATISLDEIIVTGTAGGAAARSIGNAIGVVDAEALELVAPSPNVQRMISTQVPGVRILSTGGEVGAGGVARIRGASSLSLSGSPLIYVDGIRVDGADGGLLTFVGFAPHQAASRINDFNPDDIESIEVIKGPAASTLYGTEASNGVIQIITKRGRRGRPTIDFHVRQGVNFLPDPVNLFPHTWRQEGGLFSGGAIVPVNVLQNDLDNGFGSPFRTGHTQSYGASLRGGSDNVQYYMSLDYDRDEGPVVYNWQNKLSGRSNITYMPNAAFNVQFNLGLVRSRTQSASTQQPISTAIIWACPASSCEPGGGFNALDGEMRGYLAYTPETYTRDVEGFEDVDRTTLSITGTHNPVEWLTQRLTVGGDFGNARQTSLWRANGSLTGSWYPLGRKDVANVRTTFVTLDYQVTATLDATPDLSFSTTGGAQFYRRQQAVTITTGENFPVDALETISSGSQRTGEEDFLENKTFGVFVQEQLSWRDRVFLTGAVRGDDNSAFGENFDFQVYPKLSGTWVISDEPFFTDVPVLDQVKLRAAWGKAGQNPELFSALRTYRPSIGRGGAAILTPENLGNFDLEPEVGQEIEVGFDASILGERVGVEFTYYNQWRNNAIVRVPAQPSLGFPGFQFQNIGQIENKGIEFAIDASVFETENVALDLNFAYATAKNKILSLGGQPPIVNDAFTYSHHVEGMPLSGTYARRVVAADIVELSPGFSAADPASLMCEGGDIIPGTTNFSRGGGAPMPCSSAPAIFRGQPIPAWEGAVSATVTLFDNLQLYGLVDYTGGHTIVVGDVAAVHSFFLNSKAILDRTDPILLGYEALGEVMSPGIMNAGWAKLRNLSATYTFPRHWAETIGASRMSLTFAAENLGTIWRAQETSFGHRWMDPEQVAQIGSLTQTPGLSNYHQEGWPQTRRFITTLRISM